MMVMLMAMVVVMVMVMARMVCMLFCTVVGSVEQPVLRVQPTDLNFPPFSTNCHHNCHYKCNHDVGLSLTTCVTVNMSGGSAVRNGAPLF
jgi:hypothetical protein